jgi:hypothetical protein
MPSSLQSKTCITFRGLVSLASAWRLTFVRQMYLFHFGPRNVMHILIMDLTRLASARRQTLRASNPHLYPGPGNVAYVFYFGLNVFGVGVLSDFAYIHSISPSPIVKRYMPFLFWHQRLWCRRVVRFVRVNCTSSSRGRGTFAYVFDIGAGCVWHIVSDFACVVCTSSSRAAKR